MRKGLTAGGGMVLGMIFGIAMGNVALGLVIGLVVGSALAARGRRSSAPPSN